MKTTSNHLLRRAPNSTQKPARPGFGPAAEPPSAAPASRRHAACIARFKCGQAARRCGFGTWALAAQLSAFAVGRTGRGKFIAPSALLTIGTMRDTASRVLAAERK